MGVSTTDVWMILRARDEASRSIRALGHSFAGLDKDAMAAANRQLDRGRALSTMGVGIATVGAAGLFAMHELGKGAREYDASARLALTQTDNVKISLQQLKNLGLNVAKTLPVAFDQLQPALYTIFSSIDTNLSGARKMLVEFSKDAIAGGTDLETATKANLAIMNAYGIGVKHVTKVSDFYFQLVRKGVGNYKEMTLAVGQGIPSAARAGQSYKILGGMLAFLTRNGLTAARAGTSAARAMDAISNPRAVKNLKGMGINIIDANGNLKKMPAIVDLIKKKLDTVRGTAKKSSLLKDMFMGAGGTIQAMRFFNLVTKNEAKLKQYHELTKAMSNDKGAAGAAFNIMKNSDQAKLTQATNNLKVLRVQLGSVYNIIADKVIIAFGTFAGMFTSLSPRIRKIIVYGTLLVSAFLLIVGAGLSVAGMVMTISAMLTILGVGFGTIVLISLGVVAAIAAVAAAGYLIYKNWDKIAPYVHAVWASVLNESQKVWQWLKTNFGSKSDFGKGLKQAIAEIKTAVTNLMSNFKGWGPVMSGAFKILHKEFDILLPIFKAFATTIPIIFTAVLAVIKNLVVGILGILGNLIQVVKGILQVFVGIFTLNFGMIGTGVMNILHGLWGAIVALFKGLGQAVGNAVAGLVKAIIAPFKYLYDVLVGHSIVPDLINAIVRWFASLPGKILGKLASFVAGVVKHFASLPGKVGGALAGLAGKIVGIAANAFNAFISRERAGITAIAKWARGIPGRITGAIANLSSKLYDAGKWAIQGFINGMGSLVGSIVNKAKSLAGSAVNALKHALKIGSPSKVMMKLGYWVGVGFRDGITGTEKQVIAAAKSMTNKVLSAISKKVRHGSKKKGYYYTMSGITVKQAKATIALVKKYDGKLETLAKKRTVIADKIAAYKKTAQDITDSFKDFGKLTDITDAFGNTDFLNSTDLIDGLQKKYNAMKDYSDKLQALAARGLNKDLYKQLLDAGVDAGGAYVNALTAATPDQLAQINALNVQINGMATTIGSNGADAMYAAGQSSAAGYYAGLLSDQKALNKAANALADSLVKQIKKKLGIHSPSRVMRDIGQNLGLALAQGMNSQIGAIQAVASKMSDATDVNGNSYFGSPTTPVTGSNPPVVPASTGSVFNQEVNVTTQEINPKKHAADLGFELYQRGK